MIHVKFNAKTDIGNIRKVNQDSYLINADLGLFMVCDGMGGHVGGEVASSICCETVEKYIRQSNLPSSLDQSVFHLALSGSINSASTRIYEEGLINHDLRGMGTTATCAIISGNILHCGHVGDSRLYLIREGFLYLLSTDHSIVFEQLKSGLITAEEAENHRMKNIITRCVGNFEEEYVDCFSVTLQIGDYILISSDGLHGKVKDKEICKIILQDKLNSTESMIALAKARGGEDNITAIIVEIGES